MKVLCPRHQESTPSVKIYPDGGYCYGCGAQIPLTELGLPNSYTPQRKYVEDLDAGREYIATLPVKEIRGFNLPYNDFGYYLLWPNCSYYKRRNWGDADPKYTNPAGYPQPLFGVRELFQGRIFLVEGEFNALSLAHAYPNDSVISPGSASNFKHMAGTSMLTIVRYYRTVVVVVDSDAAGVDAAIHTKGTLVNKVPELQIALMQKDANELYCEGGKELVHEEVERALSEGL